MLEKPILQITGFTDPYCTWCWGSEPILRKIREVYGAQVSIGFIMGGHANLQRSGGRHWWRSVV